VLESDLFAYARTNEPQYIVVEQGIPIPKDGQGRKRNDWAKPKFPFDEMEVGDSFAVRPQEEQPLIVLQNTCSGAAHLYGKKQVPEKKFTTRQRGTHVRIWRIL
tara:strand:- start:3005 stop:3316 length:312 start_codon:yes stop_codon:yes gene_type:complete